MKFWNIGLGAVGMLLVTAVANAEPAFTAESATVGGRLHYGADLNSLSFNPYKFGFGLGGGYTLKNGLYLGGNFDYFFGGSEKTPGYGNSGFGVESKGSVWQLMALGGYDFRLSEQVALRPYLGLGLASLNAKTCGTVIGISTCTSDSETKFAGALGISPMVALGKAYLMADVRFNLIFADEVLKVLVIGLGAGIHF